MSTLTPRADVISYESPHRPHEPAAPLSLWQKPFVQDGLPLVTSFLFHLSLIALGLLTYQAGIAIKVIPFSIPPAVIPENIIDPNASPQSNLPFGFLNGDPGERPGAIHDLPDPPDPNGLGNKPATSMMRSLANGGGSGSGEDAAIALGPNPGSFGKGPGNFLGTGTGPGEGSGVGDMGLAPRDTQNRRPYGTDVFTVRGFSTRIVFLCDASGSMMTKFDTLRVEIRRALDVMKPIQSFDVIFFSGDNYRALDNQLLLAVPENKRKAHDFLDLTSSSGSSDPIPGLRAAFATNPQLIFLLTDGDFPNNAEVVQEIRRLNSARRVRVNTIAFLDRGEEYEKVLQQIAAENQGQFKFVSEADLKR